MTAGSPIRTACGSHLPRWSPRGWRGAVSWSSPIRFLPEAPRAQARASYPCYVYRLPTGLPAVPAPSLSLPSHPDCREPDLSRGSLALAFVQGACDNSCLLNASLVICVRPGCPPPPAASSLQEVWSSP